MLTGYLMVRIIAALIIIVLVIGIGKFLITELNIPVHRLFKYRVVKRHTTFNCLGEIGEYYMFYVQEKRCLFWNDVEDRDIPGRWDGELSNDKKQRHDNYFKTFENANTSLKDLIKKRELEYQVIKAKKEDEVISGDKK